MYMLRFSPDSESPFTAIVRWANEVSVLRQVCHDALNGQLKMVPRVAEV
jgi:hypothetical protein